MELVGRHYTIDGCAYPRYRYFNEGRRSIITRWSWLIESCSIQERILNGKQNYEAIIQSSNQLVTNIGVYVFGDGRLPSPDELCIKNDPKNIVHQTSVTSAEVVKSGFDSTEFIVLVLVKEEHYVVQTIQSSTSAKDISQTLAGKAVHAYSSVVKHASALPAAIQEVLEKQVMEVLHLTGRYIEDLVPNKSTCDEDGVGVNIGRDLKQRLCNEQALKDLIEEKSIKMHVKRQHKELEIHATPRASITTTIDIRQRLIPFCTDVIRAFICEALSQALGISGSMVNTFVDDRSFNFNRKISDCFQAGDRSPLLQNKPDKLLKYIKQRLATIKETVEELESCLTERLDVFHMLGKLQFELFGLCRESNTQQDFLIPVSNPISAHLQKKLLEIEHVTACGKIYGILTIFVNKTCTSKGKRLIHDQIRRCRYGYRYKVEVIDGFREQASGDVVAGTQILADSKCGTLGCFANIKRDTDKDSNGELYALTCAHCVDCSCKGDKDCSCEVEVHVPGREKDTHRLLGRPEYKLYRPYTMDIAAIRVDSDVYKDCIRSLFKSDGKTYCDDWRWGYVCEGTTVYKVGAASAFTKGVVISENIAHQVFEMYEEQIPDDYKFARDYTILVEYKGDQRNIMPDKAFSKAGDSGSAICKENPDGSVSVVGMLCGNIVLRGYSFTFAAKMPELVMFFEKGNDIKVTPAVPRPRPTDNLATMYAHGNRPTSTNDGYGIQATMDPHNNPTTSTTVIPERH